MTEQVVLELSEATFQRAKEAARQANRSLEAILTEWLDRASEMGVFPLDASTTYQIHTPFGADATAQSLLEMLQANYD